MNDGVDFFHIDKLMEKFGWPMGPAFLLDIVGIDTAFHAGQVMAEGYPDRMNKDDSTIISKLSERFKVAVIGDQISNKIKNKNIFNYKNLSRKQSLKIISQSKNSILSKENSISFFAIDCIAYRLNVFHNIDDKIKYPIKTNIFTPIKFNDLKYSLKILTKKNISTKSKKYFKFENRNYLEYF